MERKAEQKQEDAKHTFYVPVVDIADRVEEAREKAKNEHIAKARAELDEEIKDYIQQWEEYGYTGAEGIVCTKHIATPIIEAFMKDFNAFHQAKNTGIEMHPHGIRRLTYGSDCTYMAYDLSISKFTH